MRQTVIAALGLLSLVFAGTAVAQQKLKMATIAPGTSVYQTMTTFADIVNKG